MNNTVLFALLTSFTLLASSSYLFNTQSQVQELTGKWESWKVEHGKLYGSEEEVYRFAQFTMNLANIEKINAEETSFQVGLNKFADLSKEEFRKMYLGYKPNEARQQLEEFVPKGLGYPDKKDWVAAGKTEKVKDQGQCGSCWAFGTVGGIEGAYAIATGELTSFSEQQINSCDKNDGGCNGGDLPTAYEYVHGAGLSTEKAYPYKSGGGTTHKCEHKELKIQKGQISGKAVKHNHEDSYLEALAQQPLSICIEADSDVFQFYTSGVLDSTKCGTELDHCVTAVAYDTTASEPYTTIKNSWAADWGDKGYIHIAINKGNKKGICGIYEEPYIAEYSG